MTTIQDLRVGTHWTAKQDEDEQVMFHFAIGEGTRVYFRANRPDAILLRTAAVTINPTSSKYASKTWIKILLSTATPISPDQFACLRNLAK